MRILTVRQPWAWAIIHGGKNVENRTRNIAGDYRGPVAIHAALEFDVLAVSGRSDALMAAVTAYNVAHPDPLDGSPWFRDRGAIIGVVDLIDSHPFHSCIQQQHDGDWIVCSEWAERSGHHLVLANPRALDEPIPWKGALGLRRLDFDPMEVQP